MISMTGYGRNTLSLKEFDISCEITTLNSRYLEVVFNLPEILKPYKLEFLDKIKKYIHRGKVDFKIEIVSYKELPFQFDLSFAKQFLSNLKALSSKLHISDEIKIDTLLTMPQLFKKTKIPKSSLSKIKGLIENTLKEVIKSREREGLFLKKSLYEETKYMKKEIEGIMKETNTALETKKEEIFDKVKALQDLGLNISKEDIEFLGFKGNVDEEVIRLKSHISFIETLLNEKNPVGKRLKFIVQEIQREINTIGSKAILPRTVHKVIEIKELVDELKEQAQNIE